MLNAVLKHAELILYICFFHFISRRKKRTKDSKALKRPYKSRVYIFLLSTHVSRAWRENQEGCISDDTCRYLFFYQTFGDIIWKTKHRILKGSLFFIVKTTVKVDQSSNETMVLKIFVLRSLFKKQLKQLAWVLGVQLSTQKIFFSSYYYQISVHFHFRSAEFQCMIDFCFLGISSGRETWKVCYEHPLVAS